MKTPRPLGIRVSSNISSIPAFGVVRRLPGWLQRRSRSLHHFRHTEEEIQTAFARSERHHDAATPSSPPIPHDTDLRADAGTPNPTRPRKLRTATSTSSLKSNRLDSPAVCPDLHGGRLQLHFLRRRNPSLSVKFGPSIQLNERSTTKSCRQGSAWLPVDFDFEPSVDEADTLTTPKELIFYMHWLQAMDVPPPGAAEPWFQLAPGLPESLDPAPIGSVFASTSSTNGSELLPRRRRFRWRPIAELGARIMNGCRGPLLRCHPSSTPAAVNRNVSCAPSVRNAGSPEL